MINKFLKAQHWQLFLLTFGVPIFLYGILMGSIFSDISESGLPDLSLIFIYVRIFFVAIAIVSLILFGWFWSVGVGLDKRIPDDLKLNLSTFKISLLFPLVFNMLVFALIGIMFPYFSSIFGFFQSSLIGIIFLIHSFATLCMFYSFYFVAKTIKTAELQREVSFGDFVGEFFLIWFYPIGIWIVQPTINKLMEEEEEKSDFI